MRNRPAVTLLTVAAIQAASLRGADFERRCDVPGQQIGDAVDRVIGDAVEHVAQVHLGVGTEPIFV